jgi:hypothetical protein
LGSPKQIPSDRAYLKTLIGYTGADAKTFANGPTTLSFATNVSRTDEQTNERQTRTA